MLQVLFLSMLENRNITSNIRAPSTIKEMADGNPLMIYSGMPLEEVTKRTKLIRGIFKDGS